MTKQAEAPLRARLREVPQDVLNRGREMAGFGREIWLAGLGTLATVDEEGKEVFDRMVERGKEVESHRRARLSERRDKVAQAFEENIYEPLVGALKRAGVSTREEVHDLATRVEALAQQVDRLVGRLTSAALPEEAAGAAGAKEIRLFRVVSRGGEWAIDREGRERAVSLHPTKAEATERARMLAHARLPSRLEIYKEDGTLQETLSYPKVEARV
jgi:polyhydroxyalkanoate synthesis regulator phasin